jgi:hypothetical protein
MVSALHRIAPQPHRKEDDPSWKTDQTVADFWQQQLQAAQGIVANDKRAIQGIQQQLDHLKLSPDGWVSYLRDPVAWDNQRVSLETKLRQQQDKLAADQKVVKQDQINATAAQRTADAQAGVDYQNQATYWNNQAAQDQTVADQLAQDAINLHNKYGIGQGQGVGLVPPNRPPTPEEIRQIRQEMINTDLVAIADDKSYMASMKVQLDLKNADLAAAQQKFFTDRANPNISKQTLDQDWSDVQTAQGNADKAQTDYNNAVSNGNKDISIREAHIQQLQGNKPNQLLSA